MSKRGGYLYAHVVVPTTNTYTKTLPFHILNKTTLIILTCRNTTQLPSLIVQFWYTFPMRDQINTHLGMLGSIQYLAIYSNNVYHLNLVGAFIRSWFEWTFSTNFDCLHCIIWQYAGTTPSPHLLQFAFYFLPFSSRTFPLAAVLWDPIS